MCPLGRSLGVQARETQIQVSDAHGNSYRPLNKMEIMLGSVIIKMKWHFAKWVTR
jgi:hypothetical protein